MLPERSSASTSAVLGHAMVFADSATSKVSPVSLQVTVNVSVASGAPAGLHGESVIAASGELSQVA